MKKTKHIFSYKDQSVENLIRVLQKEREERENGTDSESQKSLSTKSDERIPDEEFYAPPSKKLLADLKRCAKKLNKISDEEAKRRINEIYKEYGEIKRKNGYKI